MFKKLFFATLIVASLFTLNVQAIVTCMDFNANGDWIGRHHTSSRCYCTDRNATPDCANSCNAINAVCIARHQKKLNINENRF